jgi:hypothetical protein
MKNKRNGSDYTDVRHKLKKNKTKMTNLLQENKEMKSQRTNSTFAIRTSQLSNPKLQKSYFLPTL